MGNPLTVHNLKGICKFPPLRLVSSTRQKNQSSLVKRKRGEYGFSDRLCVEPVGRAGSLVLRWKDKVQVRIVNHDQFFLSCFRFLTQLRVWNGRLSGFIFTAMTPFETAICRRVGAGIKLR